MKSTNDWWSGEVDWSTPAGQLLLEFIKGLPPEPRLELVLYGSAPLQLTVDRNLLSADIDLFSVGDHDLAPIIERLRLGKEREGLHIESGYELSFRTSLTWKSRAKTVPLEQVLVVIPHPIDILTGKLDRLEAKDLLAFERVIHVTGHPTQSEFRQHLQNSFDLFRPSFDEERPNRYFENTQRLWREIFHADIDVRQHIIARGVARRQQGYGEPASDYKATL
jgi:hypothetical protein